jgi:geranylgeranyl transferase type-2 subunit beta
VRFVLGRRRDDGGFVEIGAMRRSGTNPTAAAAVLLDRFGALTPEVREGIGAFLAQVRGEEGGVRANTRVPFCDALSTFTALLVALDLGVAERLDLDGCRRFAAGLELADGGFRGAAWDAATDPEYTFYGLGTLALAG